MDIDNMTVGDLKQVAKIAAGITGSACATEDHPYPVGKPVFIRGVTMYYTGRLVAVYPQEIVIEDAAWIPDTGRFADALGRATFGEVEPFPAGKVVIGRGSIVDCCRLVGDPPRDQS